MGWHPTLRDFDLLRAAGLLLMALIFGPRLVPALRPHAGRIALWAVLAYLAFGAVMLLWGFTRGARG